jgi:rRNA-processing protein FCF1
MKILIDECVPRQIKRVLESHEVQTVAEIGLSGIKNGELIKYVEGHFDLFITSDRNLRYQQNLSERIIPIIELSTNDRDIILSSKEKILATVSAIEGNSYLEISLP